jgi:nucleotide-binding universal stress UspA family protein
MIPKIKKILYATDLSENARYAFSYAADLAQRYDTMITILYVMENINHVMEIQIKDMMGQEKWDRLQSEKLDDITQKIKARLEDFCKEMDSQIDSCRLLIEDIRITKGNPTEIILKTAKDIHADMIVMGSHGHNILRDAFIGGTARRVVKKSETPVLVVKLPKI